MEEELLLQQPADRRLGNDNLPPGPPGAESDEIEVKKEEKPKSSHRKSPSPTRRKSSSKRSRRSPSSPRRGRYRYSPERRGRYDRRRSPPPRDRDRDRYRAGRNNRRDTSNSRSRSRSATPPSRRSGRGGVGGRWSPKKKPNSPPPPPPISAVGTGPPTMIPNQVMQPTSNQYGIMQPPPAPQLYGGDAYSTAYGAPYGVPPPHTAFGQQADAYANYNTAYPPPNAWGGHDAYVQQTWIQPPNVSEQNSQIPNQQADQTVHAATANFPANSNVIRSETTQASVEINSAHDAAVAQEAENQREELKKQRSSYIKKNSLLKKELKMLKDQRKDLDSGTAPPSPTTKGFIDENDKLQNQIMKKIATIENVIEMLTGVIGEEHVEREEIVMPHTAETKNSSDVAVKKIDNIGRNSGAQLKVQQNKKISTSSSSSRGGRQGPATSSGTSSSSSSSSSSDSSSSSEEEEDNKKEVSKAIKEEDDDSSPERLKHKVMESMRSKQRTLSANAQREFPILSDKLKLEKIGVEKHEKGVYNYAFYDPEMHWCQRCNVFPKTAKDYLNHLHSIEHMEKETTPDTPWHTILVEDYFPTYENAPTKRMPIRGITFFVPATAWYCKLCCIWMGDLHCASMHLKSRHHSSKYSSFLDRNPNFEINWLADRQRVLNEKNQEAAAPQITAVSTTGAEDRDNKKSKKNEEKLKKHKKNSEKKDKKKKKKRSKKRKKAQESTSDTSSSDSSSSDESDQAVLKKKKSQTIPSPIKELDNPNPAASIRVSMRKNTRSRFDNNEAQPPPPPAIDLTAPVQNKWSVVQEGNKKSNEMQQQTKNGNPDDPMLQQWNTVQPVISDNEKKLLEQLKGKLKATKTTADTNKENNKDIKESLKPDNRESRNNRRERDVSVGRHRSRRTRSRSWSRSPTRSRSRGRDWRRGRSRSLRRRSRSRGRRSRSHSRGRYSPIGRGGRRRRSRSRSHRRRTRSRSRNRRNRRSRTRSRSGSRSNIAASAGSSSSRVEKPVVQHPEFRPRVPEKEKEKDKKSNDSKDKKDSKKSTSKNTSNTVPNVGKKLPFIGKMPVFKKQTSGQNENELGDANMASDITAQNLAAAIYMSQTNNPGIQPVPPPPPPRAPAPTAAQINMAMMEDVYGNAPPFHPEAGVMHGGMDYDDLMPDPVQFVNLMAQAPPPPAEETEKEDDVLPPGIDEMETEEFVPKPRPEPENDGSNLPKDLEEALNIIFPGERKSEDDQTNEQSEKEAGETQIIVEEPVMQMNELYKEGIHLVTIEETSMMAIDEASRLSMNEPLVFNKVTSKTISSDKISKTNEKVDDAMGVEEPIPKQVESQNPPKKNEDKERVDSKLSDLTKTPDVDVDPEGGKTQKNAIPLPDEIPMPSVEKTDKNSSAAVDFNLDDIPNPPAPLTETEKKRRQEELDELAMLGIDADDMAAQRM